MQIGTPLTEWEAHDKRIWSVDFSQLRPDTFVSGSDDGCVKVRRHSQEDVQLPLCTFCIPSAALKHSFVSLATRMAAAFNATGPALQRIWRYTLSGKTQVHAVAS